MRESSEGQRLNSRESCPKYGLELAGPVVRARPPRGGGRTDAPAARPLETWAATQVGGQRRTKGVGPGRGLPAATGPRRGEASKSSITKMSVSRPRSISMSSAGRSSQNKRRPSFLNEKGEVRLVENGFDLTPLYRCWWTRRRRKRRPSSSSARPRRRRKLMRRRRRARSGPRPTTPSPGATR